MERMRSYPANNRLLTSIFTSQSSLPFESSFMYSEGTTPRARTSLRQSWTKKRSSGIASPNIIRNSCSPIGACVPSAGMMSISHFRE